MGPGFAFCAFCLFACLFCHMVARKQRDADGSHEPGVGRSRDGAADVLLEGAEHRVVAERAALHHDMLAEAVEVGHANDLREHVRDDRPAQARHDVGRRAAVFLLVDDARVHEYGAAAAEHGGLFAGERRIGDLRRGDAERLREVLEKRAAAARAGLVYHDVADDAVGKPDGFHVLAADVEEMCIRDRA